MKITQLAKDCVRKLPPDILMHPMPFPDRLDYAEKIVQEALNEGLKEAILSNKEMGDALESIARFLKINGSSSDIAETVISLLSDDRL